MSWYDYLNPITDLQKLGQALGIGQDPAAADRAGLQGFAQPAGQRFNASNLNDTTVGRNLQDQASGKLSLSSLQLQQGLQQQLAQQQALQASASPQNAAMAARLASMNSARLGYGMSGAAATAGIQERQSANDALAQLAIQQRQQDLNAALGGYQSLLGNPAPTTIGQLGPAIGAGLSFAATKSDRRAKEDVEDADDESKRLLEGLKAYRYKYKDSRDGQGEQYGVMAQDLERAGLGHAVIDTPRGKFVDGGKAATSALALTAALARRVSKLEGRDG